MKIFLTIKNYRCFVQPARIEINKGFTAFIGANNAGKSAIMRFLLELRGLFDLITNKDRFLSSLTSTDQSFQPMHVFDPQEIFSNLNKNDIEFWFDFTYDDGETTATSPSKISFTLSRNLKWQTRVFINDAGVPIQFGAMDWDGSILRQRGIPAVDLSELFRIIKILGQTCYVGPFRNTINVGAKENYFDINVGQAFIKQFRELKTGSNKQENEAIIQLTEDIKNIFEFNELEISAAPDDQSLHITINDKPYKQHELGSGLLQFILVLANASIRRPAYILIDEPESNLHPRLQLDFLTTLGSYASEGVWFATHSIGLARSTAERVYSVLKQDDGSSVVRLLEETPRLAEFLGEMSFSSYKELGFKKILLVEGSTDVLVFQQFLRKLSKDHLIVLLPLSGQINGNMADQLEEIKRITTEIAVIIDSERTSLDDPLKQGHAAFVELCEKLDIPCHVLIKRAIENYFPQSVIQSVFGKEYRALNPYQKLSDVQPNWGKGENYKLAREMSSDELEQTDWWSFLKSL